MTTKRFRICEYCADRYLPFQTYYATDSRHEICDVCNRFLSTEFVQEKPGGDIFFGAPFVRDYDKIFNELDVAFNQALLSQNFELVEDIANMVEKFEFEQDRNEKVPND